MRRDEVKRPRPYTVSSVLSRQSLDDRTNARRCERKLFGDTRGLNEATTAPIGRMRGHNDEASQTEPRSDGVPSLTASKNKDRRVSSYSSMSRDSTRSVSCGARWSAANDGAVKKRKTELSALVAYIEDCIGRLYIEVNENVDVDLTMETVTDAVFSLRNLKQTAVQPLGEEDEVQVDDPLSDERLWKIIEICHGKCREVRRNLNMVDGTAMVKRVAAGLDAVVRELMSLMQRTCSINAEKEKQMGMFHLNLMRIFRHCGDVGRATDSAQIAWKHAEVMELSSDKTLEAMQMSALIAIETIQALSNHSHQNLLAKTVAAVRRSIACANSLVDATVLLALKAIYTLRSLGQNRRRADSKEFLEAAYEIVNLIESVPVVEACILFPCIQQSRNLVLIDLAEHLLNSKNPKCAIKCLFEMIDCPRSSETLFEGNASLSGLDTWLETEETLKMVADQYNADCSLLSKAGRIKVECYLQLRKTEDAFQSFQDMLQLPDCRAINEAWLWDCFMKLVEMASEMQSQDVLLVCNRLLQSLDCNATAICKFAEIVMLYGNEHWIEHVLPCTLEWNEVQSVMLEDDNQEELQNLAKLLYANGVSALLANKLSTSIALLRCALLYSTEDCKGHPARLLAFVSLLRGQTSLADNCIQICACYDPGFVLNDLLSLWLAMEEGKESKAIQMLQTLPASSGFYPSFLNVVHREAMKSESYDIANEALVKMSTFNKQMDVPLAVIHQNRLYCLHQCLQQKPVRQRCLALQPCVTESLQLLLGDAADSEFPVDQKLKIDLLDWFFEFCYSESLAALKESEYNSSGYFARAAVLFCRAAAQTSQGTELFIGSAMSSMHAKAVMISITCLLKLHADSKEQEKALLLKAAKYIAEMKDGHLIQATEDLDDRLLYWNIEVACRLKLKTRMEALAAEVFQAGDLDKVQNALLVFSENGLRRVALNVWTQLLVENHQRTAFSEAWLWTFHVCLKSVQIDSDLIALCTTILHHLTKEEILHWQGREAVIKEISAAKAVLYKTAVARQKRGSSDRTNLQEMQQLLEEIDLQSVKGRFHETELQKTHSGQETQDNDTAKEKATATLRGLNLDQDDIDELCLDDTQYV